MESPNALRWRFETFQSAPSWRQSRETVPTPDTSGECRVPPYSVMAGSTPIHRWGRRPQLSWSYWQRRLCPKVP